MYPSDFSSAEDALSPVDDPLFLGVPPLLALVLILLVLGIAIGAYWLGRRQGGRSGTLDADAVPQDIHKAVLAASTAALAAPSDEIRSRAKALRAAIDDHLGPILQVSRGVIGPVGALDEALKGEIREPAKTEAKGPNPVRTGAAPIQAVPPPVTVNQIFVGSHSHAHPPPNADTPNPRPASEPAAEGVLRPMTGPEQIDALSRAIRAFHDHWSRGPDRVRELKAARAALSRRPTAAVAKARH